MPGIETSRVYNVHSYEVGSASIALPHTILGYMQDVAMEQSDDLGAGRDVINGRGLAWVVTRYHVSINELPKYKDKIKVTTRPLKFNKLFAYREFLIENDKSRQMVNSLSQWMLVDKSTHEIRKIGDELREFYGVENDIKKSIKFKKLREPSVFTNRKSYRALYTDVDFNGHVNNTRYMAWVMDAVPQEVRRDYTISEFDILFKKELLCGESFDVNSSFNENSEDLNSMHVIKSEDDRLISMVSIVWKLR